MKRIKLNYEDGDYKTMDPVEIDKLSFWELKGIPKKVEYDNAIEFLYLVPS